MEIETWPIDKLVFYASNPRKNDHVVDNMAAFIEEYGFRVPVIAKSDGLVVDGHLRLKAAKKLGIKEIPVVLADDLSDTQIRGLRISINKSSELAEWDEEMLAIELGVLTADGFDVALTGFDIDVHEFEGDMDDDDEYTKKITAPIYEPKNEKPPIHELFNSEKSDTLEKEIRDSEDISEEEKVFLIAAANRHTVFNYQKIADYYANSDKHIQDIMEKSALVIIDFKKALQNGYVKLSEEIAAQYLEDYPDNE